MEEDSRAGSATAFSTYRIPLSPVSSFKCLSKVLSEVDDYWPAVVHNLRRAWQKLPRLKYVLGREGADDRTSGMFYLAVVKSVLLYGFQAWVMYQSIGRTLGLFHHRVGYGLTGRQLRMWS